MCEGQRNISGSGNLIAKDIESIYGLLRGCKPLCLFARRFQPLKGLSCALIVAGLTPTGKTEFQAFIRVIPATFHTVDDR
jgi:hypothetical protein